MLRRAPAILALALVASCGGKITPSESDAAIDAKDGADASDTPPAACGVGLCTPGSSCSPDGGCNTCNCSSTGWACTLRACLEAGPPPTPPSCPSKAPPSGLPCLDPMTCLYASSCGSEVRAVCASLKWTVTVVPCP